MQAAVYDPRKKDIFIEDRPIPSPDAHHLLVRVGAVGICGSDVHYYKDGHIGDWWIRQPHVLGHEFAGTVAAVGANVTGYVIGDQVAVEPILPCDTCDPCKRGLYNLCENLKFTGSPHTDGAFQEYVVTRPRFTHHLPEGMSLRLAALVEPTSVAVHAVRRSQMETGASVAVIGAGPIGLLMIAVARACGARDVFVADLDPVRLEKAQEMGATHLLNVENPIEDIAEHTDGRGVDVTFEAVGLPKTIETGLKITKAAGRLVVIGVNPGEVIPFNLMLAQSKEIEVAPIYLGRDAFPQALELLASGQVPAEAIITHTFPLAQASDAMQTATTRIGNAIKVMLEVEPTG